MAATIDDRVAELERANAELRRQLDACGAELKEAREQQTATAEVLGVINSSPGDLAPVFDAMLDKAMRLCEAAFGVLLTYDGEEFHAVAKRGLSAAHAEFLRQPVRPSPGNAALRIVGGEAVVHIADLREDEATRYGGPARRAIIEIGGGRTQLMVSLRKDNVLVGMFVIYRQEVRPFSDKQIALLQNFAAQAVIAMENGRLLKELQQRTGDLQESLEYQTATSDVLKVISRSTFDLQPVLETLLETAARLCGADKGGLNLREGEAYRVMATFAQTPEYDEFIRGRLSPTGRGGMTGRVVLRGEVVHVADIASDPEFTLTEAVTLGKARTMLGVPLLRDGIVVGTIALWRIRVQPFTDRQIDLVRTFADQAVIAMESARLLTETREALEQQTATAEVLQIINSSPGDLAPVFDAMLDKALNLCGAAFGILQTIDGKSFQTVAHRGVSPAFADFLAAPREVSATGLIAEFLEGARFVHRDAAAGEGYRSAVPVARALVELEGARTLLSVPLRKDATLVGWIVIYRREVRPFTDKQIALLQNFAAQAVIAMENARLITETREALEQQTATAEVLQVINSSPGDLAPVFDAMIRKAVRLCGAVQGSLRTFDGEALHLAAWHGDPSFAERARELGPIVLRPGHPMEPLLRGQRVVHLADAREATANSEDSAVRERVAAGNIRSWLAVALRTDGGLLGSIAVSRHEVRPFTDKQIALLQNFAAQAVIAMENARLITETREALEQQTATAEVLGVINSSPGDLTPVFDAILEKATRLCEAAFGILLSIDGEELHAAAMRNVPQQWAESLKTLRRLDQVPVAASVVQEQRVLHIRDVAASDAYRNRVGITQTAVDAGGVRSALYVPLVKDNRTLSLLIIYRQEVRPFSDKQIALLQNFAAQAVIAMENARLITETREALEQQTATAEVLQVINSSPGDLAPVFDAMLDKALDLCGAAFGNLWTYEGGLFHAKALRRVPPAYNEYLLRTPVAVGKGSVLAQLLAGSASAQVADAAEDEAYTKTAARTLIELGGARTVAGVALRKDEKLLGAITIYRQQVQPFSDKQIELLQNFAAQAVIAMENARLISETREALEQQTATAEVLQVINSSPGDLAPVFEAMLEKATRLSETAFGAMFTYDGERFHITAAHGPPALVRSLKEFGPISAEPGTMLVRHLGGELVVQRADIASDQPTDAGPLVRRAFVDLGGARSSVSVALQKDRKLLGVIQAYRQEVRPFSDKQIALLQNFAAQAVIAMENARLLTETREALEQQTATAEVLQVINSSPGDLAPVFDAMLEKAIRLCGGVTGVLWTIDGERGGVAAARGLPEEFIALLRERGESGTNPAIQRVARGEPLIEFPDTAEYFQPEDAQAAGIAGVRSLIWVAMVREGAPVGAFAIGRPVAGHFSDKQIALLQNFAAQAVIAMENARLITETREALEQQTATAEVLQVINSSPGDLVPVFDTILEKAHTLCGAAHGIMMIRDAERFRTVAVNGVGRTFVDAMRQLDTIRPREGGGPARLIQGEQIVQFPDLQAESFLQDAPPQLRRVIEIGDARTMLMVPLRKDDDVIGIITAFRQEVRLFTNKQIALLQNFAAQAVIAMENARLITETREALEQQTATAEVLQVINSSPGELAPVFDAMLDRAIRLCEAAHGHFLTYDGETFHPAAVRGEAHFAEYWRQQGAFRPSEGNPLFRLVHGERIVHLADAREDSVYRDVPVYRRIIDIGEIRTSLTVPLRKDGALLGAFVAYRQEVRPFSDKQIALLQNFAAQAVIAMENARLITETREALEQQTATAEVLQVINSSPGDLAPVFDAMLEKAMRLCEAALGVLWTYDGNVFHAAASRGAPPAYAEFLASAVHQPGPNTAHGRLLRGSRFEHLPDVASSEDYRLGDAFPRALVDLAGGRTILAVPLRKDDAFLGDIFIYRQEVRPFTDKQIALLQNFAAQAVIAMENARLLTETREALEQQTATAEVLQVINSSPGDLAPVFGAVIENSMRLCEATQGHLYIYADGQVHAEALRGEPQFIEWQRRRGSHPITAGSPTERALRGEQVIHIVDATQIETYRSSAAFKELIDRSGIRTGVTVALRRDEAFLGTINVYRQEVRPFSDKQIALLQNFAGQAVIAMENARLLTETREALEQQTATAEVLQVINSSPGDLTPVFDAILEKAHTLCDAERGALMTYDGEYYRAVALHGMPEAFAELLRRPFRPLGSGAQERLLQGERLIHVLDAAALEPATPIQRAAIDAGVRTVLLVPLRKDGALLGYITAHRREVRPFSGKQIALLESFAAQAVIAMENARLLGELRQRTSDLEESLEYQTATSDVLRVISGSVFDLEPVLQTVLSRATDLCRSPVAEIFRLHDGGYRWAAGLGVEPEYEEIERRSVIQPGQDTLVGRVALERRMVHVADVLEDPLYGPKQEARLGKFRTMLGVPLLRDDMVIGVIAIARWIVEPYTDKEIRLVTTFADQAVIAIENARLLGELRERTAELGRSVEELKMLGDVGRAVSSTLDLRAVLSTILTASLGMTWASAGAIFRYIRAERAFRLVEAVGWDEALLGAVGDLSIAETETLMSEAALSRSPIQLTDLAELPSTPLRDASLAAGLRSVLIVPLVGPERIFGALVLQRREAGEFPAETVRLMQTLASQSVLAIQNARLFREIADKSEQLALASQHKSQFLANMSHELRTPLNAILGYAELLVDGIYGVLPEKAQGVLERVQNNGKHLLALINDVLDLAKIEAGQLALTLEDYALAEVVRGVVTATEPLAAAKGLKFTAIVQEGMPMAHGDARRVSQVLLNLAGNAIKFTDAGEVEINASAANGQFVLEVSDTGPGIADADQERIFGEFQQIENNDTRKKGGTGLGLAISKRMVEMQGGMISVDSTLGRGSTFRVVLPVQVEPAMEEAAE